MSDARISRREAAKRFFLASAAIAAPGWLATACSKEGGALTCTDAKGLTADETKMRTETLAYVEKSTDPAKTCKACALYKAAAEGQCGSCQLVKGPINPAGTCKSFAPKPT
jgi:hypothetical protein